MSDNEAEEVSLERGVMISVLIFIASENYMKWWSKMQYIIKSIDVFNLIKKSSSDEKEILLDNRAQALVISQLKSHSMNVISDKTDLKSLCSTLKRQYTKIEW